jgi:NAD(P)-dependent dehydrogenase (short-subunit alcohol dehydrogenase family)
MTATAQKVWFITGASRGFGLLTAKKALERGDFVVATARDPQTVIAALGAHPNLLAVRLDVKLEAQAITTAQQAVTRFGRIDVLVNNAGYGLLGAVEEAHGEEIRALYETNVFGLLNVTRAVLPVMRRQGSGHVMNISSVGGYSAYAGWGVYSSTKFAVEGLSEAMSMELAPLGINVTVVEPGFFRTDFLDASSLVAACNWVTTRCNACAPRTCSSKPRWRNGWSSRYRPTTRLRSSRPLKATAGPRADSPSRARRQGISRPAKNAAS